MRSQNEEEKEARGKCAKSFTFPAYATGTTPRVLADHIPAGKEVRPKGLSR